MLDKIHNIEVAQHIQELATNAIGITQPLSDVLGDTVRLRLTPEWCACLLLKVIEIMPDTEQYMTESMMSRTHHSLFRALREMFPNLLPVKAQRRDLEHFLTSHVFTERIVELPLESIYDLSKAFIEGAMWGGSGPLSAAALYAAIQENNPGMTPRKLEMMEGKAAKLMREIQDAPNRYFEDL